MSHLNNSNIKLQGEKGTKSDLTIARKNYKFSNMICRVNLFIFQEFWCNIQAKTITDISNLSKSGLKTLLLFIKNTFLVTGITTISIAIKDNCKFVYGAKIQLELIEIQENVAVKEIFCNYTPEKFWLIKVYPNNVPHHSKISSSNFHYIWVY